MNKEFIPYEQALELKELGFNEHCIAYYFIFQDKLIFSYTAIYDSGDEYFDLVTNDNPSNSKEFVTAPLYQQAFRWFREKHTYQCYIQFMNNSYAYWIGIKSIDFYYHSFNSTPRDMKIDSSWETYEEAELACLKKLIEIVKNK